MPGDGAEQRLYQSLPVDYQFEVYIARWLGPSGPTQLSAARDLYSIGSTSQKWTLLARSPWLGPLNILCQESFRVLLQYRFSGDVL